MAAGRVPFRIRCGWHCNRDHLQSDIFTFCLLGVGGVSFRKGSSRGLQETLPILLAVLPCWGGGQGGIGGRKRRHLLHQPLENLAVVAFPAGRMLQNPVKHEHVDHMGIGKAIAVLTSGGDAQGKWISSSSRCFLGLDFCWVLWWPEEATFLRTLAIPVGEPLGRTLVFRCLGIWWAYGKAISRRTRTFNWWICHIAGMSTLLKSLSW